MYAAAPFGEHRTDVLHEFIRRHPLAVVVTGGAGGLEASHLPLLLDAERGLLRGHMARNNPHWRVIEGAQALAIFNGPSHYITPAWYESKREHGKVVPTWNYVTVHAAGRARLFDDGAALLDHLRALTKHNEASLGGVWSPDDAPAGYIEALSKTIVGVEIAIERMEGKWKLSQNRPDADRRGTIEGLKALGSHASLALAEEMEALSHQEFEK